MPIRGVDALNRCIKFHAAAVIRVVAIVAIVPKEYGDLSVGANG